MTSKQGIENRLADLENIMKSVEESNQLDSLIAEVWIDTYRYIGEESGWDRLVEIATDEFGMDGSKEIDTRVFMSAILDSTATHRLCKNVGTNHIDGQTEDFEGLANEFRKAYPDCLESERSWRKDTDN